MNLKPSLLPLVCRLAWCVMLGTGWACLVPLHAQVRTLEPAFRQLGDTSRPEYAEFYARAPQAALMELSFEGAAQATASTLLLRQKDVKETWNVLLNGIRLGRLTPHEGALELALAIPEGTLRDGRNTLQIHPAVKTDTITVGDIRLDARPVDEAIGRCTLELRVEDAEGEAPLPARLTVVDALGYLTPLRSAPDQPIARRAGVIYTGDGRAMVRLQPGRYTVYATRGFEYSLARRELTLKEGERQVLRLALHREVDTGGWISCDPHTHTVTYSGHGDASVLERVLTLAGEGIEMPVATDHNVLADYESAAVKMKVRRFFTPVLGTEVTTRHAHFNIFPIEPDSPLPDIELEPWAALITEMRHTPGVEVVMLNHPHNIHNGFRPFDRRYFNPVTGQTRSPLDLNVDALEVLSSSALQSDPMLVFKDWFALLNGGHRLVGLGSSDVHDVNRYIVGQGRTYIRADDGDPANLDVAAACTSLQAGRALISMGLMVELSLEERFFPGDLATDLPDTLAVKATVRAPQWIRADRLILYANGRPVRTRRLDDDGERRPGGIVAEVEFSLPRPRHDQFMLALATGPAVTDPYWPIPRPYQSRSRFWSPQVIGATNPIWIDADGDGRFLSARALAQGLFDEHAPNLDLLLARLEDHDPVVASHVASLLDAAGLDFTTPGSLALIARAPPLAQEGFSAYLSTLRSGLVIER